MMHVYFTSKEQNFFLILTAAIVFSFQKTFPLIYSIGSFFFMGKDEVYITLCILIYT